MKKFLITAALPYANGPLHFGHLAGSYIPADTFNRHKKQLGKKTKFICGSDEHGVAIMLNAQKEKTSYKEYVDNWHIEHKNLFDKMDISFDFFGQTSAEYHKEEVLKWFKALHDGGFIEPKDNDQLKCQDCKNHLPDRFVEGVCYSCGYEHARGDECPKCGIWIEPEKLKNPVCKICSSKNLEIVTVTQHYLMLSKYYKEFRGWFDNKKSDFRKTVYGLVDSLTKEELVNRAITRDLDWGIDVPLPESDGKKLYVWFDAPIGYVSNTKQEIELSGSSDHYLDDWWNNKDTSIHNFMGKDNIIFHGIIFPMMSMASKRALPVNRVEANQYLNLMGKQFSKSTGWYVDMDKALENFGPDTLRYYLTAIAPENQDSSFSWDHFAEKVNNELANNIGNLVNRCLKFWAKNWTDGIDANQFKSFLNSDVASSLKTNLAEHIELLDASKMKQGLEKAMAIGNDANVFFSERAPWAEFKEDAAKASETIAWTGVYIYCIASALSPYLPGLSSKITEYYGDFHSEKRFKAVYQGDFSFINELSGTVKLNGAPKALVPKIDLDLIKKLTEELEGLNK